MTRLSDQMDDLELLIADALEGERRRRPDETRRALEGMAVLVERAKADQVDPTVFAVADEGYQRWMAMRRGR